MTNMSIQPNAKLCLNMNTGWDIKTNVIWT